MADSSQDLPTAANYPVTFRVNALANVIYTELLGYNQFWLHPIPAQVWTLADYVVLWHAFMARQNLKPLYKLPFTKIWPVCQMGLFEIKLGVPYNNWQSYTIHMKTKPMNYRFLDLAQLINGGNQGSSSVSENLPQEQLSIHSKFFHVFSTKKLDVLASAQLCWFYSGMDAKMTLSNLKWDSLTVSWLQRLIIVCWKVVTPAGGRSLPHLR